MRIMRTGEVSEDTPLRVLYVGNFSATFCTEVHVAASLAELGCEVVELQEDRTDLATLERETRDADLILYTRTIGFWRGRPEHLIRFFDNCGVPSASYHLDLYAGLKRGVGLRNDPFWRTRHVFSADGGSQAFFARHGIEHTWIRPGVYGRECYLAEPSPELACDVLFVGSGGRVDGYHPEWPYRGELVDFLQRRYGSRFHKRPEPGGCYRGHKLNVLYASARVVVGDTLCLGPEDAREPRFTHARYSSDRLFETVGRGGFLIYPRMEGMTDELLDGEHVAYYPFGDFEALAGLIDHYLAHPEERKRIRRAGHERVKAGCTYVHRCREMLDHLAAREPSIAAKWPPRGEEEAA